MARKKDLGGLAALAGLAYMASRDKAAKGEAPVGDAKPSAAPDMGEIRDEEGTVSKLRRNTETGELYDPTGTGPTAPASKPAATRSAAKNFVPSRGSLASNVYQGGGVGIAANGGSRIHPEYDEDIAPAIQRDKDDEIRARDASMKNYRSRAGTRARNKENLDATGETFKKGGSVKGWGIARGARKAKTY